MKESIFVTLQKCTVFEGFTPEEIREALSMVSYRMVELAARETYVLAGMPCRYADIIVEGEMIARMSGLSGKQLKSLAISAPGSISSCIARLIQARRQTRQKLWRWQRKAMLSLLL